MSQIEENDTSINPKTIKINILLNNFQGLQYDIDDVNTKYQVSANCYNKIFKSIQSIRACEESAEITIECLIDLQSDDDIIDVFLNPLLLTLLNEKENFGYCIVDLMPLLKNENARVEGRWKFVAAGSTRKIQFDAQISTNVSLNDVNHENVFTVTVESIHNMETEDYKIGLRLPFQTNKASIFEIKKSNFTKQISCKSKNFKKYLKYSYLPDDATYSNQLNERYEFPLSCDEKNLLESSKNQLKINAFFRSPISAQYPLYDYIRKSNKLIFELTTSNKSNHYFGLIDCDELLNVGRKRIQTVVPLYEFQVEMFRKYSFYDSLFNASESDSMRKSRRSGSKKFVESLNEICAMDNHGNRAFIVMEIELETALNEEVIEDQLTSQLPQKCGFSDENLLEIRKELSSAAKLLCQDCDGLGLDKIIQKAADNGFLTYFENSILPKVEIFRRQMSNVDDETFLCDFTSKIINSQKSTKNYKFLAEFYAAVDDIEKCEEIYLQDIMNGQSMEDSWTNFAIFNVKREDFDTLAISINEVLKINPKSLISNLLKTYLLFKTHKHSECLNTLRSLRSTHGLLNEIITMEFLINKFQGIDAVLIDESPSTHDTIECIYSSPELSWNAVNDRYFLSWNNRFIKNAIFFIKIGCYDIAELCLGEYYEVYGININYLYLLAFIDASKGNYKKSLQHLNRIAENDVVNHQMNHSKIISSIILNLLNIKEFAKAKDLFNTYIQSCDNFLILYLFGLHHNRTTNEFEIAKDFLIQATKLKPCYFAFRELGKCFYNLKIYDLAENVILSALKCEMSDVEMWTILKDIYTNQKRFDAASFCGLNSSFFKLIE